VLTQDAFLAYCQRLELSAPAQALLTQIRAAPPSRRVQGRQGNVTCRYPSRKMGCIIQAESVSTQKKGEHVGSDACGYNSTGCG
jgi:putative transposase